MAGESVLPGPSGGPKDGEVTLTGPDQAYTGAHLRPLQRCYWCTRPATEQLFSGRNAPMGTYCDRHAQAALRMFKRSGGVP